MKNEREKCRLQAAPRLKDRKNNGSSFISPLGSPDLGRSRTTLVGRVGTTNPESVGGTLLSGTFAFRAAPRSKISRRPRRRAAEYLKIIGPIMAASASAPASKASSGRLELTVASGAASRAVVRTGGFSSCILECAWVSGLLVNPGSRSVEPDEFGSLGQREERAHPREFASAAASSAASGSGCAAGLTTIGGSADGPSINCSAWASATDLRVGISALCCKVAIADEDGFGDATWRTFRPSAPRYQHLRCVTRFKL